MLKRLLLAALLLVSALPVLAQQGGGAYVEYIELQPPFITNYGGPGPLKYLKAEVSIKVTSREAEAKVKLHQPNIRNNLVFLLSRQNDDSVNSAAGREQIRRQALEAVREILVEEYGQQGYEMVGDLLFTSFVVQS
ncbi:flagellar basal body-associated FliL family protein [Motiliproteus sp. SC1-56]|uniref:flagellar basal body-associated FliL family protein n=1 Tax=Motiliproteus sp. SC1-56 TaxID=2799565 RepID=UPI001A904DF9|nr:flagellar basal body-associated FliL family protein [Motiliproteus sp. SC1-56]